MSAFSKKNRKRHLSHTNGSGEILRLQPQTVSLADPQPFIGGASRAERCEHGRVRSACVICSVDWPNLRTGREPYPRRAA